MIFNKIKRRNEMEKQKKLRLKRKKEKKCICLQRIRESSSPKSFICPVHGQQEDPGCPSASLLYSGV